MQAGKHLVRQGIRGRRERRGRGVPASDSLPGGSSPAASSLEGVKQDVEAPLAMKHDL